MADNFKYGLYDRKDVVPGYFGSPAALGDDDRLKEFGLFDDEETVSKSSLLDEIKQVSQPSFLEQAVETGKDLGIGSTIQAGKEVIEGGKSFIDDIKLLSEGRVDETTGLLGDFVKAGEGRLQEIEELNRSIDETGGNIFDKAIGASLNVLGAGVDFTGDVLVSGLKTLAPEGLERATEESLQNFLQTEFGQGLVGFIKEGGEKIDAFKKTSPEAERLVLTVKSLLPLGEVATGGTTSKLIKEVGGEIIEAGVKKAGEFLKTAKEGLEIGGKELSDIFKTTKKGKDLQKEIEVIRGMGKQEIPTDFRNTQAESIIASTNSMLPLDKEAFRKISGKNYQTWLNERGFRGTGEENIDLLAKKFIKEKNSIDSALELIPGRHNPKSLSPIMDEILDFARATDNTVNVSFIEGVQKGIDATGGASAKDIRKIKQIYERENKFAYIKDTDSVKTNRATNRDNALREDLISIADEFGLELRDVSKELQQTVAIMNGLGKKLGRQTEGNVFDISDRITGPLGAVEPTILLGLGAKKVLTSDALKSRVAKILGTANVKIPTLKEPRLRQKIKEYEALQKELKKATKKAKKQAELETKKKEIEEIIVPDNGIKNIGSGKDIPIDNITGINKFSDADDFGNSLSRVRKDSSEEFKRRLSIKLLQDTGEGWFGAAIKLFNGDISIDIPNKQELLKFVREYNKNQLDPLGGDGRTVSEDIINNIK